MIVFESPVPRMPTTFALYLSFFAHIYYTRVSIYPYPARPPPPKHRDTNVNISRRHGLLTNHSSEQINMKAVSPITSRIQPRLGKRRLRSHNHISSHPIYHQEAKSTPTPHRTIITHIQSALLALVLGSRSTPRFRLVVADFFSPPGDGGM